MIPSSPTAQPLTFGDTGAMLMAHNGIIPVKPGLDSLQVCPFVLVYAICAPIVAQNSEPSPEIPVTVLVPAAWVVSHEFPPFVERFKTPPLKPVRPRAGELKWRP